MPQRRAAQKRLRADKKRRQRNLSLRKKIKDVTKKYLKEIEAKNLEEAKKTLKLLYKELDKAAFKKYIHRNRTARQKSRLTKKLTLLKEA